MGNCLEVKNISKAFVGVQALDNISFRADGGEVCALLGENGAGKSTLLKILSGAQTADSGEYYINGEKMEFKTPLVMQCFNNGLTVVNVSSFWQVVAKGLLLIGALVFDYVRRKKLVK